MVDRPATDPLDIAARAAFRRSCNRLGGHEAVAAVEGVSLRKMQRIYAKKCSVPPGLGLTIARALRNIDQYRRQPGDIADAVALEEWAGAERESPHG